MEKEAAKAVRPGMPHALTMENRQKAALSGVSEVLAFDENQVILSTDCGEIALTGEGRIDGVIYTQRGPRRRLFGRKGK